MRVKICGITRPRDLEAAIRYGADALGFVIGTPSSPRNLTINRAKRLMKQVPVFNMKVAVTSSTDLKTLRKISDILRPDALQLHNHSKAMVQALRNHNPHLPLILGAQIEGQSIAYAKRVSKYSDAIIADSPSNTGMGGTGRIHDWALTSRIRDVIYPRPLILAGGLTPMNVRSAIQKVRPYAVDVSSGVEKTKGVKDHMKMKEFVMNAKENDT
ncbi:MAG TPA: phosphoribosylanthranilate isomerase [Candidatus Bathyarchaeia archaeon]|nr:phosphoribosylanthranilate isomerase [Candidatus Bathyarchaeia archaeon]